jgi:hypothetical protein
MKTTTMICAVILILGVLAGPALAKDLKGNLGIGFNSQFSPQDLDSLSAKYWINNELAVQGLLGFNYSDAYDETDIGGKVYFKVNDEENLHVDVFAGLGLSRVDPDKGSTETGKWISIGMGLEYFFSGLPNLGFSTEVGLTMTDYDDDTSFGTMADSFVGAGIHYYFDFLSPSVKKPAETGATE